MRQGVVVGLVVGLLGFAAAASAADLAALAQEARSAKGDFHAVDTVVLRRAAGDLREALGPLDRLLARSKSGRDWRAYLDWPTLSLVAAGGTGDDGVMSDVKVLDELQRRFESDAKGLEMPAFAGVRRSLDRYRRASQAATDAGAAGRHDELLERLATSLDQAATEGTADALEPLGRILDELEATGQSTTLVTRVREATGIPNLLLDVDESLLSTAVNRDVDETSPIDELILGTRVRGTGRTTGSVMLDFVPSHDRAAIDLVLDAMNHSRTSGGRRSVTVFNQGVTKLDARKRVIFDGHSITPLPTEASASATTTPAGMSISSRFGRRLIQKIATKKAAEIRPQAEFVAESRAREKLRLQFDEQTASPIAQARHDFRTKFRDPLQERGWFPEMLQLSTSQTRLSVVARKSLSDQIAAASAPPVSVAGAVLAARVHDTLVNNVAEMTLSGRTVTQADVEELAKSRKAAMPEAFASEADQEPWAITFARRRPVELDTQDDWLKLTIRGDRFASGDREFPAMDIWASYRVESGGPAGGVRLVRDGDVQIYPPGFVPGGDDKLSVQETSLRRILQRRFNKVFKDVVDVEPLELQGQLAAVGPLPMSDMVVRKSGWVSVGWRTAETRPGVAAAPSSATALAGMHNR